MNAHLVPAAVIAAAMALHAGAQTPQKVVADQSYVRFVFKQMNVPVEGRFRKFDATVAFDPGKPEATRASFEVDLASIELGAAEGEAEARRKPWLNVEAFPKATFVATAVRAVGNGRYLASGPLTIKGVARDITAPFTVSDRGGMRTVEGQFDLRRLQFRIGEGVWSDTDTVADEVAVHFKFVVPTR